MVNKKTTSILAMLLMLSNWPLQAKQWMEVFDIDGSMGWAQVELPVSTLSGAEAAQLRSAKVTALHESGPSDNRFDLVILGDGYTEADMPVLLEHAQDKFREIAETEPFTSYLGMFNVWLVHVVSPESGVDNDPYPGPDVSTALDMQFWCNGIERLLCVDNAKASAAAEAAPDVDHILVLANSSKYGGAGGNIATSSGGNANAALITTHELGHSIANLADEYEYYARAGLSDDSTNDITVPMPLLSGGPGMEPGGSNITAESSTDNMAANELKWFRWLGEESPDGGIVGTYEGGGYSPVLLYRATEDSLMHTLGIVKGGNPFNLIAIEQFIAAFHRNVNMARKMQSADGQHYSIAVEDFGPAPFDIRWYLDGEEVVSAHGAKNFAIADTAGAAELRVEIRDTTASVRDPQFIAEDLTETLTWDVSSQARSLPTQSSTQAGGSLGLLNLMAFIFFGVFLHRKRPNDFVRRMH